ncbi:HlyC/CorC family transporter [Candidatus Aerophobetes bacterium]|nr:HlyC/CorC family transporter [Candidatus Aerophobetes bacterium]
MTNPWIILVLLICCIFLSGFFSGSEIALSSLSKIALKKMEKENPKKGKKINLLLSKPSQWLITILIGNNLVNIAAASLATILVQHFVKGTPGLVVGMATGAMTFVILVFGEITPKRYSRQHAEIIALKAVGPILFLSKVFAPAVNFLTFLSGGLLKISKSGEEPVNHLVTEKEIHTLIDIGQEEGALEKGEEELAHSALEFDETRVKEIMTPRTKIICIPEEANLVKLSQLINKAGYSRIPVYRDRIDNVVGIAYAKDLLKIPHLWEKMKVKDIMHPPIFVPYTVKLSEIFHQLQKEKTHLAIVVDEYGGVAGLITIEDLLEELVGEIEDEYDSDKVEKVKILGDGSALVEGDTDIDEINERLGTFFPEKAASFESIGGLIFTLLGRMPKRGEKIKYNQTNMEVIEADERRIKKVKIWK